MRADAVGKIMWPRFSLPRNGTNKASDGETPTPEATLADLPTILIDLHRRQLAGEDTSLRQLHRVSDVSQPRALRMARQLEHDGLAVIEPDLHDLLASRITLTRAAFRKLRKLL